MKCVGPDPWNAAYVQPSRRPADGRYGDNPNRLQHYYQFQVILKPSPDNIQQLCLDSLYQLGVDRTLHDLRFVEDDWENPSLGASGLGWEVWCDTMEILQFTYMQKIGGIECSPIPGEITYGLERLTMFLQNVDSVWDITWNKGGIKYRDVYLASEQQHCAYNFEHANVATLFKNFEQNYTECMELLTKNLVFPAYEQCLKAAHNFNLLDARGVVSSTDRASYIAKIRHLAKNCCTELCRSNAAS